MTSPPPGGSSEAPGLGRSMKWKPGGDERRIATSADDRCHDSVTTSKSMLFARIVSATARYFLLNEWMFQVGTRIRLRYEEEEQTAQLTVRLLAQRASLDEEHTPVATSHNGKVTCAYNPASCRLYQLTT